MMTAHRIQIPRVLAAIAMLGVAAGAAQAATGGLGANVGLDVGLSGNPAIVVGDFGSGAIVLRATAHKVAHTQIPDLPPITPPPSREADRDPILPPGSTSDNSLFGDFTTSPAAEESFWTPPGHVSVLGDVPVPGGLGDARTFAIGPDNIIEFDAMHDFGTADPTTVLETVTPVPSPGSIVIGVLAGAAVLAGRRRR